MAANRIVVPFSLRAADKMGTGFGNRMTAAQERHDRERILGKKEEEKKG